MPALSQFFSEVVRRELPGADPEVEAYIVDVLVRFMRTDHIFGLRDSNGHRLMSVSEMIPEGDVALNAPSFDRERVVHRHIGDFLLFWSGVFPEFLSEPLPAAARQGKESYHLVSMFDMPPHDHEAPTFRKLSQDFEDYTIALRGLRRDLGGAS
ncbi:MAG: hypothetical protein IT206_07135 [Fimbriimonadaceae bacterium]|nr:hypothetical protein [Fimbriimonadaceae bacterium]